jgi:hypothetical protein
MEIIKSAIIISTATGYNVNVYLHSSLFGSFVRRHRNITAASLKRFYALSSKWMQYTTTKEVPFDVARRLFEGA